MSPLWRRAVACLCAASLLLAGFPVGALAAPPAAIDPAVAMKYLRDVGVYTGDDDLLKTYLQAPDDRLTPIGEALYRSLRARYNTQEAVDALKPALEKLRKAGPYDAVKRQTTERALASFQEKFGDISRRADDGTVEGSYQWGTLVEAYMSGLAAGEAPKAPNYTQIALADGSGHEFWDDQGLAFRINTHKVTTYSRELQKTQKLMNADRPRQVPFIPETGRYSFEMLQHSYWRLKNQYEDIALALRVDRMALMAQLLGIQVKDERFYLDPKLMEELETKAKTTRRYHRDRYWTVLEVVEKRMEQRRFYLEGADAAVKFFETDMNRLKGATTMTDAQVQSMTLDEKNALRWLSLSVLATQEYAIKNQMEVLDPTSPDAQMLQEALQNSPLDSGTRLQYSEQGVALRRRLESLQGLLSGVRDALNKSDYAGSLDMVQAALASAQREMGEISADYSLYVEAPSGAFLSASESGRNWRNGQLAQPFAEGWTLGNWGVKLYGAAGSALGTTHGRNFDRVAAQLPAYDCISRAIAMQSPLPTSCVTPLLTADLLRQLGVIMGIAWGQPEPTADKMRERLQERVGWADLVKLADTLSPDHCVNKVVKVGGMAAARCLSIAMNPQAASRFQEVRFSGGSDAKITDALRVASSLRANRMELTDVAAVNKWARTAASYLTWTVTLALGTPAITGVLRSFATGLGMAANGITKIPVVGGVSALPFRLAEHAIIQFVERAAQLNPARSEIPAALQTSMLGRYAASSGIRWVNAAGRQFSFTALSGVISTGFTVGMHAMDGGSSNFTDYGDAAWQGLSGGVVWANDSFHPMLGYIGMPSTAYSGLRYAAPVAESLAARGALGNVAAAADGVFGRWLGANTFKSVVSMEAASSGQWALRVLGDNVAGRAFQQLSKVGAFGFVMTDQIAKYVVFSKAASIVAREMTYANALDDNMFGASTAFLGLDRADRTDIGDAEAISRRMKRANSAAHAWEASPVWLLLPVFPARQAIQGAMYQRAAEGMRQYDKPRAGPDGVVRPRTADYANAVEGDLLRFLDARPKAPLSQRIFEWSWKTQENSDVWIVTKEARAEGIRKALNQEVGAVEGNLKSVNPMRFIEIMDMPDNARLARTNLAVKDEVRELARKNLAQTLVANPELAIRILKAPLGSTVEGFGVVRVAVRREIAATLHVAESALNVKVPKNILAELGPAHERYVQSDRLPKEPAAEALAALKEVGKKAPGLDKAADFLADSVSRWREGKYPERIPGLEKELPITEAQYKAAISDYNGLMSVWRLEMRARVRRGEMTAKEGRVVEKFFDAVTAIEQRFNSFNNPQTVREVTKEVVDAVGREFKGGSTAAGEVIEHFRKGLSGWKPLEGRPVAGRNAGGEYAKLMENFEAALRAKSKHMKLGEQKALQEAVIEMKNAPWAVRDKGGNPLPGWRPEQFESFATALAMMMKQGKGGQPIRLFQMLKTGGGKTMLTYEGLLPFAEADAKAKKMEVAFLTVQSNLEAQARADYFAYKKLDSKLTFDTYEGLKTKIAEGKTKGEKTLHRYWILGDEMDGAALQPALTIGEVTGRITRRSSVFNRIEELDLDLSARLESVVRGRTGAASLKSRDVKAEAQRLTMPTAEAAKALEEAVERLVRSAENLQRAAGPEAALRAQRGLAKASTSLRSLIETVRTPQADGVRRVLGELDQALASPPAGSGAATAADAALLADMQSTFRRQRNLLQLSGSEEGLQKLVLEARKQRLAGEQRLTRLERDLQAAKDSGSPLAAETLKALSAEIKLVKAEVRVAEKFEGMDAGARVIGLSEKQVALEVQVARAEGGPQAPARLAEVKSRIAELEKAMPTSRRTAHAEHRDAMRRVYETGARMGEADAAILAAAREGKPVAALKSRLNALEAQRATQRARVTEKSAELGSGAADGALGPGLQRLRILRGQISEARAQALQAQAQAENPATSAVDAQAARRDVSAFEAQARTLERDMTTLVNRSHAQARELFSSSATDILAAARTPGNEAAILRQLQARRKLMESFAGEESPIYTVYREMKNDMEPIAHNQQLLSENKAVYDKAADLLLKKIDGGSLFGFSKDRLGVSRLVLPSVMKMTYQVFAGKPVTAPVDRVGLTRLHAAKLLKALFSDPIMPPGQRQSLFWTMAPSLLFPKGPGGRSSWVRAELLKLVQAFHENPAGIRMDGLTKKINVVHNGQWFESMDNEGRRFWELEYGTDLTLPYTHRSISTIRDLTTDKRAHFISFSGTAGEKFRQHLDVNKVQLAGKGSVAPEGVKMDLRASQAQKIASIREAILESALLSRDHVVIRSFDNMPPSVKAEVDAYMAARPVIKGKDAAVVRISEFSTQATRDWLTTLRATQPKDTSLVVLSVSDTRVLKLVRNYMIRSGLVKESEIAMVFSDAEFLRLNRPDAKVHEQMNLNGLEEGRVRVLILDTRVGGRGLDLNYKGDKRGIHADPFRGYSNYKMLVIDPHEMSAVHLLQAQGRIDVGRVLAGAHREFSMVMDVKAVQGEAVFRKMMSDAPFFVEMRKDPGLEAYARSRGATKIDWALVHEYIAAREIGGTPEAQALAKKYRAVVQEHLERRQLEVEEDQLRSSSVSDDPATSPGRHPGLLRFAPGR